MNIQEVQELLERWVITEQQETALIVDWQFQEQIMRQHILLLEEEEAQLNSIVSSNTNDIDTVTERRLSLLELQNSMESDQGEMTSALLVAFASINSLHAQLPPPLATAWQERLDDLAVQKNIEANSNSNTQLQALLEMLSQLEDFQQRVNLHEATIITAEGTEVLVKQLYLGVSHAWYASADGVYSGYGHSTPTAWVWENSSDLDAGTVQQAITMLERNINVELVELPILLQSSPLSASIGSTP